VPGPVLEENCVGSGDYSLVGEQVTPLVPQLLGGVTDDCGQLSLAAGRTPDAQAFSQAYPSLPLIGEGC
jgi:hypothetical protein